MGQRETAGTGVWTKPLHGVQHLDAVGKPRESASAAAIERYRAALASFDWRGAFIDDARGRAQWCENLRLLHLMQAEVDPDGAIWRDVMPKSEGGRGRPMRGAPLPITRDMRQALSVITGRMA